MISKGQANMSVMGIKMIIEMQLKEGFKQKNN